MVGEWVDKYPESVKALSDAGHEVMNHSNTHPHLTQLSREQIIEEIKACDDKIEAVTGRRPNLTRPPYGDYNDKVVGTLREIGHYTIQWDVEANDMNIKYLHPPFHRSLVWARSHFENQRLRNSFFSFEGQAVKMEQNGGVE